MMTNKASVRALQRGLATLGIVVVSGCTTVYPPVVIKDSSKWTEQRAIDVINQARRTKPDVSIYYGNDTFKRELACHVNENGLTSVVRGDLKSNQVYIYHAPFSKVTAVRMERTDICGVPLIFCGLLNPFIVSTYHVTVNVGDDEMRFIENHKQWGTFPFWLCRPFYFLSSDRFNTADQLSEALEYLRLNSAAVAGGPSRLEDVNWAQHRAHRVPLSQEEALAVIRGSLQRAEQQSAKNVGGKGVAVLERLDRRGYAIKYGQEAEPSVASFGEVTGLGIVNSGAAQEAGVALMAGGRQVGELPFASASERDKLLSALEVLCEPFDDRDAKWGPVTGRFVIVGGGGPGYIMPMGGPGFAPPPSFRPPMR